MREYFEGKDWYDGIIEAYDFNENNLFNDVEKANRDLISPYDEELRDIVTIDND